MAQHAFQAEVRQLLDIVINSLYTDKEIFLRELVSNASDSLEKLRHLELTHKPAIYQADAAREIRISIDEEAKIITIQDAGIGMTEADLVKNLGTIAHSGSKAFLAELGESEESRKNVIGKFGVGFYSVFMVADQVQVFTHHWEPDAPSLCWTSDGSGGFTVEEVEAQPRGCRIVIHLKESCHEFAQSWKLKGLLEKHSNFVSFPIVLGEEKVNTVEAIWLKGKNDVTDEQFKAFYKFISHKDSEPTYRFQFNTDSPIVINTLLFVPEENEERWGMGQIDPAVALYCRRVLIDSKPKGLLPDWLRFLKGVIDSEDLPLNISRETMQDSSLVKKLNDVITKRFLKFLEEQSNDDAAKYETFYKQFGRYLKEGIAMDYTHREKLGKLLRFESSLSDGKLTSLDEYLTRAKDGQEQIYYQVAPNRESIESGPYLEAFKSRGLEVIYFYEAIDEYVCDSLGEFGGKQLVSVERDEIKLDEQNDPTGTSLTEDEATALCSWTKGLFDSEIESVRSSTRLVDSPAAVFTPNDGMTAQMRNMMKAMNQALPPQKLVLELNPKHELIQKLHKAHTSNPEVAARVAAQLVDNARIAAGVLEDPRAMVQRMQQIMNDAL
jgi:TNF receptor-associated protein 1